MCQFFSFVTNPDINRDFYYFDWQMRQSDKEGADSHSHICAHFKLNEDRCNKWEYNPLTKTFTVGMQNAKKDDSKRAEKWVRGIDWKLIVKPLVVKPIVNPFDLPKVDKVTEEQIGLLKKWASVWDSVGVSVRDSVRASVWDLVWASVETSVWTSVGTSVRDLVWAYASTFFDIEYKADYSPATKLWEAGLVPSFDGETWRLHSGKNADVVYEWMPKADGVAV